MTYELPTQPATAGTRLDGTSAPAHLMVDHLHGPYIQAIEVELAALGVGVRSLRLHTGPIRSADLEVVAEHRAEPILVRWDEINGWSVQTRAAATELAVFFGIAVVPPPIHLATWLYLTLQHLDVTPSRAGAPQPEPSVDIQLYAYHRHG